MEEKKNIIRKKIELRMGFGVLGEKLNAWGEDKFRKATAEANRQEVEGALPTTLEEAEAEIAQMENLAGGVATKVESGISENMGIRGGQSNLSGSRDTDERSSGGAELGGWGMASWVIWLGLYLLIY